MDILQKLPAGNKVTKLLTHGCAFSGCHATGFCSSLASRLGWLKTLKHFPLLSGGDSGMQAENTLEMI